MLAGTPILTGNTIEKQAYLAQFLAVRKFGWILHEMFPSVNTNSIYMVFKFHNKETKKWKFVKLRVSDHVPKKGHTNQDRFIPEFSLNGKGELCELIQFLNKQRRQP